MWFKHLWYEWANSGLGPVDGSVSLCGKLPGSHGDSHIQRVLPSIEFYPTRLADSFAHMNYSITSLPCTTMSFLPFIFMWWYSFRECSSSDTHYDSQKNKPCMCTATRIQQQSLIPFSLNLDWLQSLALTNKTWQKRRSGIVRPCSFCLGLWEHLLCRCPLLEPNYHILRGTSHTGGPINVLWWTAQLSSLSWQRACDSHVNEPSRSPSPGELSAAVPANTGPQPHTGCSSEDRPAEQKRTEWWETKMNFLSH